MIKGTISRINSVKLSRSFDDSYFGVTFWTQVIGRGCFSDQQSIFVLFVSSSAIRIISFVNVVKSAAKTRAR